MSDDPKDKVRVVVSGIDYTVSKLQIFPSPLLRSSAMNLKMPEHNEVPTIDQLLSANSLRKKRNGIAIAANQAGSTGCWWIMEQPFTDKAIVVLHPNVERTDGAKIIEHREGCLSIPGFEAVVPRYSEVRVSGSWLVLGVETTFTAFEGVWTGIDAMIAQHEFDHLNGLLYIDRLPNAERSRIMGNALALKRKGKLK